MIRALVLWIFVLLPTHSVFNRWRAMVYRRLGYSIGDGTFFCSHVRLKGSVRLGRNCSVNENVLIASTAPATIHIGDNVLIGPNVVIRNANHIFADPSRPIREQGKAARDIMVGNDVWVAANVVVLPGARIGDGSVIAAGSVVRGEIPGGVVAAGVPARVVKVRDGHSQAPNG